MTMKMTINEVLEWRKEVSAAIKEQEERLSMDSDIVYGERVCGDKKVGRSGTGQTFQEAMERLSSLHRISEEINSRLGKFNAESGVSDKIRARENLLSIVPFYDVAATKSKAYKDTETQTGEGGQTHFVETQFNPFEQSKDLRKQARQLKARVRQLQRQIRELNMQEIMFSFELDEIEELTLSVIGRSEFGFGRTGRNRDW